ncbi:MAG: DUF3465 domain-containing protein [Gammaproteobacteria bacterium]
MNKRRSLVRNRLLPVLLVLGLALYQYYQVEHARVDDGLNGADNTVQLAYAAQQSGVWLETGGQVIRVLKDDNEGSRHQRFILELADGHSVLIAHNIDLAERIPVRQGLSVTLRGRYEWNDRGGVIHWTHHDPEGRESGGWIMVDGTRYE